MKPRYFLLTPVPPDSELLEDLALPHDYIRSAMKRSIEKQSEDDDKNIMPEASLLMAKVFHLILFEVMQHQYDCGRSLQAVEVLLLDLGLRSTFRIDMAGSQDLQVFCLIKLRLAASPILRY